jgi:RNA polymerase sigma factor (sigma-70 family)
MQMTIDPDQYERLHSFARRLVLDDPEDLVQDAWLTELEQPRRHTDAYLKRSLRFRRRARSRSRWRRRARESVWASADSEAEVAPVELLALQQALGRLTTEQRRLIEARYIEGREPREIAVALGLSPEVVRQRLHRALLALRRELEGERGRALLPLGFWRRWGWPLAIGSLASVAAVAAVCVAPNEDEPREPEATAVSAEDPEPSAASDPSAAPPAPDPTPEPPAHRFTPSASPSADLLGAAWLLEEYREGYLALMKEVQGSFIECLAEHNRNPPPTPVAMTGKTVFRVRLRSEADTGVFAEEVETREDTHTARPVIECIRESLPSLALPEAELEVPNALLVVVENNTVVTTTELDLTGMPVELRDDVEQIRRIGRYLTRWEPPTWAGAALAELAVALGDGVIEAGELDEEAWATLQRLEDPDTP